MAQTHPVVHPTQYRPSSPRLQALDANHQNGAASHRNVMTTSPRASSERPAASHVTPAQATATTTSTATTNEKAKLWQLFQQKRRALQDKYLNTSRSMVRKSEGCEYGGGRYGYDSGSRGYNTPISYG